VGPPLSCRASEDLKLYTLRHFLFYMGVSATAGAAIGALARRAAPATLIWLGKLLTYPLWQWGMTLGLC
jgi:hypothetical protein